MTLEVAARLPQAAVIDLTAIQGRNAENRTTSTTPAVLVRPPEALVAARLHYDEWFKRRIGETTSKQLFEGRKGCKLRLKKMERIWKLFGEFVSRRGPITLPLFCRSKECGVLAINPTSIIKEGKVTPAICFTVRYRHPTLYNDVRDAALRFFFGLRLKHTEGSRFIIPLSKWTKWAEKAQDQLAGDGLLVLVDRGIRPLDEESRARGQILFGQDGRPFNFHYDDERGRILSPSMAAFKKIHGLLSLPINRDELKRKKELRKQGIKVL